MENDQNHLSQINFIGQGSYGTVFGNDKIVYKKINLVLFDKDEKYFTFIDSNIRELIFYKTIKYKTSLYDSSKNYTYNLIPSCKPDSIPVYEIIKINKEYNIANIVLKNYGTPVSKIVTKKLSVQCKDNNFIMNKNIFSEHLFSQIGQSLLYMHKSGYSHGDIKLNNILFKYNSSSEKINFTLIDFGSICFHHTQPYSYKFKRTTIAYSSPEECKRNNNYYKENDIWSFGCILYEIYTGNKFLKDLLLYAKQSELFTKIFIKYPRDEQYDAISNVFSSISQVDINKLIDVNILNVSIKTTILKCLVINMSKRHSIGQLLNESKHQDVFLNSELIETSFIKQDKYVRLRDNYLDIAKNICRKKWLGNTYAYGHSVMLFDRFLIRFLQVEEEKYDMLLVLLLCITISTIVLNCELVKSTDIIDEYYDAVKKNISNEKILEYFYMLIEKFDFLFFNYSFDLHYPQLHEKKFEKIVDVCKKYILSNNTTHSLIQWVKNTN
jgi:serine/threonine protein kinase